MRVRGTAIWSPTTSRTRIGAFVALALLAVAAATVIVIDRVNRLPENAVLRIGDEVVTVEEFNTRADVVKSLYGVQPPRGPGKHAEFKRSMAKAIVVSKIIDDAAKERGVTVSDKAVRSQLDQLIKNGYNGDRSAFVRMLGARGVSEDNVRDELRRQLVSARLFANVTAKAEQATEADARKYYEAHRDEMSSPEQRRVRNIVVETKDKANQVLRLARRDGADFAALAKQYSLDGSTRGNGGDLGFVRADQLATGYSRVAFDAEQGALFGPVKTQSGWNVGKIVTVKDAVPLSFQKLRKDIMAKLNSDAKIKIWSDWLSGRIKDSAVDYADEYRPTDPDALPPNFTNDRR